MTLSPIFGSTRVLIDSDYHRMGKELIQPFDPVRVQPASYDITLASKIMRPWKRNAASKEFETPRIDLRKVKPADYMHTTTIFDHGHVLEPGYCALVSTVEIIRCPADMICSVDGKSTLGRCWLAIHVTAGFIDPGFVGAVTLELVNHGPWDFVLYPGMPIGQLRFHWLGKEVDRPYGSPGLGSHYQGATEVKAAAGSED